MSILEKLFVPKKKGLNIIIVGAGKVGITLADMLTQEGNNIVIIDKNQTLVNRLSTTYDIMGIVGNGSSYSTLIEAGIENADIMIAVTDSDELNLLCCTLAKKVGNCSSIARVRTPDYANELSYLRDKLGISLIINPELEAAKEINRILHFNYAMSVNAFAKGAVEMIKFKLSGNCNLIGKKLMDFPKNSVFDNVLICAVERNGEITIPNGSYELADGDIVSFIATPKNAYAFFDKIGLGGRGINSVMIIGGGRTSFYLANFLCQSGVYVKIIEIDPKRCNDLNELLPDDVMIVNGDGTDEDLLSQESFENMDAVIPLTGLDEENVLLSLYAMKTSYNIKAVTKVNHINFSNVINSLNLGSIVYPRQMTAEIIRTYVRAKKNSIDSNLETMYHIFDDRAVAIEYKIKMEAKYTNVPLRELNLKDNLLIASIRRDGKSFIPGGDDCFMPGDSVVFVTTHTGINSFSDIFKR